MSSLKVSRISLPVYTGKRRSAEVSEPAHRSNVETGRLVAIEPVLNNAPVAPYYLQLMQRLSSVRAAMSGVGVFAFTAANPGDGVSFVVKSLASALARSSAERVLTVPAASLGSGACAAGLPEVDSGNGEQGVVYAMKQSGPVQKKWEARYVASNLDEIRRHFGWVLIDCASLRESDQALAVAPHTGGVVVVVAADKTKRSEIVQARKSIELSSGSVLGFVLNKRTWPVPEFLYQRL
jgi:Mrp family chromosome partitioning ATPase